MTAWLGYMKKTTIIIKIKGVEGRHSMEPQMACSTSEYKIVSKFGGHVLCCLASSLLTVVR